MHKIVDTFIMENSGKDNILDFEGSMIPGIARFYESFGSEKKIYKRVRKNRLPKIIRWLK